MATEKKTKTTVKNGSEQKRTKDSKSVKTSPSTHARSKKTPDPGPMKKS